MAVFSRGSFIRRTGWPDGCGRISSQGRELREIARTTHDQEARGHLLTMADPYDLLAKHAEDDGRKSKKP
jgi:hypothetical protein